MLVLFLIYPRRFWIKCLWCAVLGAGCGANEPRGLIFRVNIYGGLTSLDPAFAHTEANAWLVGRIYDTLLRTDDTLGLIPALARTYTVSADGMEYRFILRRDAYFHSHPNFGGNGTRAATARDVEYSFTRLVDPAVAAPGQWLFNQCVEGVAEFQRGTAPTVSGFQARNDTTFVIRLSRPFAPFLRILTSPYASVVARETAGAVIGTGPFRLHLWREGRRLILHKNRRYYAGAPQIDAVVFRFISGKTSAFHEFLRGGLDYLDAPAPAVMEEVFTPEGRLSPAYAERFEARTAPQLTTEYIGLLADEDTPALADARVRKALALAIDRRRLARPPGAALPTGGFIPEGMPGFRPRNVSLFDPDSARRLLKISGQTFERPLVLLTNPAYRLQAEFVQKSWKEIGVPTIIEEMEGAALRSRIASGGARAWRASWVADYPDPENFAALFYSLNIPPAGPNYTRFSLPEYDSLYRAAVQNPRPELYELMENLRDQYTPVIVLYYYRTVRLIQKGWDFPNHPLVLELEKVVTTRRYRTLPDGMEN